jgi:hypothetical protein
MTTTFSWFLKCVLLFFKDGLLSTSQFVAFSSTDNNQQKVAAVKNCIEIYQPFMGQRCEHVV